MDAKRAKIVTRFSCRARQLVAEMAKRLGADDQVWRMQERIYFAADQQPEFFLARLGRELFRLREPIEQGDWGYFLSEGVARQVSEAQGGEAAALVRMLQQLARALPERELGRYQDAALDLLDLYIEHQLLPGGGQAAAN
jgi:hypothetical protein